MAKRNNDDDKKQEPFLLPEARVIHHSLFKKDQYNDKAVPAYKIEVAIDADDPALDDLYNRVFEFAEDAHGEFDDDDLIHPLKDGDKMAKKRERNGKNGDEYKGKIVIRANTIYNHNGDDDTGGVAVYDEDKELINGINQGTVYPGCYGFAGVTMHGYTDEKSGEPAVKFYLTAFQRTKDGDRIVQQRDNSKLFKPVGRKRNADEKGGKRRGRRT